MIQPQVLDLDAIQKRLRNNVVSDGDLRVCAGVERIGMDAYRDRVTDELVPFDSRIKLTGYWSHHPGGNPPNVGTAPVHNAAFPASNTNGQMASHNPGATMTISFYGVGLALILPLHSSSGTFTVSIDGGSATTYNPYSPLYCGSHRLPVATGLALGDHTVVITITGNSGGGASCGVWLYGIDVLVNTLQEAKYLSGTGFPDGRPTSIDSVGTLSATLPAGSLGARDLVVLRAGSLAPEVIRGETSYSTDTRYQFLKKNEVAYRVEAEDRSNRMAIVWTNGDTLKEDIYNSNGSRVDLGDATTSADTSSTPAISVGFIGTGIDVVMYTGPDCGNFAWSINGGSETIVDGYSPTNRTEYPFQLAYNLPYGYHTLKIRKLGTKNASSTGYRVRVDAFDVYQPRAPLCPVDAMPLADWVVTPDNGWIRMSNLSGWKLTGTNWLVDTHSDYTGGSRLGNNNTNTTDKVEFTFVGTQCRLLLNYNVGKGIAAIYIDGVFVQNVDSYNNTSATNIQVMFTSSILTPGFHTLEVRMTNTKNASSGGNTINFDSFEYKPLPMQVRDLRSKLSQGPAQLEVTLREHLKAAHLPAASAQIGVGAPTTSSTSIVAVGNTLSISCSGRPLLVIYAGELFNNTSSAYTYLRLMMDGVGMAATPQIAYATAVASEKIPIMSWGYTGASPGIHTFNLGAWVNSGTATLHGVLLVFELTD
jgi:hypothetical protein